MIFMFLYAILTVVCRHDFTSHRNHGVAWLLFLLFFLFWAKQSYSFLVTFGRIVRDTKVPGEQPVEQCYALAGMSVATLAASFVTFYSSYDENERSSPFIYYSFEYLLGAAVMSWHAKLLRDFHTEPSRVDLKKG